MPSNRKILRFTVGAAISAFMDGYMRAALCRSEESSRESSATIEPAEVACVSNDKAVTVALESAIDQFLEAKM